MNTAQNSAQVSREDGKLVDLVTAALVDPNLHTDTRMRLQYELTEILRKAHHETYGDSGPETHERRLAEHDHHLPQVLESVLVDPNLHTDQRMRLHEEIEQILKGAR